MVVIPIITITFAKLVGGRYTVNGGRLGGRAYLGNLGVKEEGGKEQFMNPFGLIFVAAGVFSIAGAIFDWDWFMNVRKARFIVRIFTRGGARVFYGLLGIFLVVLGTLATLGIIGFSK